MLPNLGNNCVRIDFYVLPKLYLVQLWQNIIKHYDLVSADVSSKTS